jgi:dienelactone hydrolase
MSALLTLQPDATATDAPPAVARPPAGPSGHETTLFRVSLAAISIAVIDDAFLHPEQGTGASDHLAGGLVPLAVAALLTWIYPRLRAGARATASIACGVLAMAAGVADGVRHVAVDQLAGDDLAVMLGGVAGVVLVALGAVLLWRSRRLDEQPLRRYARRTVVAILAGAATLFVLVPATIAIVATHRAREPVAPASLGRAYERVAFTTADGLRLAGWYVPSRNRAAVVLSPGRRGPVPHARMLVRHGYGVLLFDRRGEGQSDGDFNAYGWGGDADLKAAIGFLTRRDDVDPDRIGGLGLSVGGEMLLETAAEDDRLRAVVAEGASVRSLAEHWDDPALSQVQKPFTPLAAQTLAVAVFANEGPPPSLLDLVDDIAPRSLLLIRGLEGQPAEILNRAFHGAAGEPKELWEVPGARHTAALAASPQEYERRVVGFFDRALFPSPRAPKP